MDLRDRVVLVTGGGKRVGRAIAMRLAKAGAHIAVHYHTSATEAERTAADCAALGMPAGTVKADLADPAETAGLVAQVFDPMTLVQFNTDDWERTLRVNLTAPMVLAQAAWPALKKERGRIINLSDAATNHPWPGHLAYIVSKGALDLLTRVLARAMAPEVNVVGVAP